MSNFAENIYDWSSDDLDDTIGSSTSLDQGARQIEALFGNEPEFEENRTETSQYQTVKDDLYMSSESDSSSSDSNSSDSSSSSSESDSSDSDSDSAESDNEVNSSGITRSQENPSPRSDIPGRSAVVENPVLISETIITSDLVECPKQIANKLGTNGDNSSKPFSWSDEETDDLSVEVQWAKLKGKTLSCVPRPKPNKTIISEDERNENPAKLDLPEVTTIVRSNPNQKVCPQTTDEITRRLIHPPIDKAKERNKSGKRHSSSTNRTSNRKFGKPIQQPSKKVEMESLFVNPDVILGAPASKNVEITNSTSSDQFRESHPTKKQRSEKISVSSKSNSNVMEQQEKSANDERRVRKKEVKSPKKHDVPKRRDAEKSANPLSVKPSEKNKFDNPASESQKQIESRSSKPTKTELSTANEKRKANASESKKRNSSSRKARNLQLVDLFGDDSDTEMAVVIKESTYDKTSGKVANKSKLRHGSNEIHDVETNEPNPKGSNQLRVELEHSTANEKRKDNASESKKRNSTKSRNLKLVDLFGDDSDTEMAVVIKKSTVDKNSGKVADKAKSMLGSKESHVVKTNERGPERSNQLRAEKDTSINSKQKSSRSHNIVDQRKPELEPKENRHVKSSNRVKEISIQSRAIKDVSRNSEQLSNRNHHASTSPENRIGQNHASIAPPSYPPKDRIRPYIPVTGKFAMHEQARHSDLIALYGVHAVRRPEVKPSIAKQTKHAAESCSSNAESRKISSSSNESRKAVSSSNAEFRKLSSSSVVSKKVRSSTKIESRKISLANVEIPQRKRFMPTRPPTSRIEEKENRKEVERVTSIPENSTSCIPTKTRISQVSKDAMSLHNIMKEKLARMSASLVKPPRKNAKASKRKPEEMDENVSKPKSKKSKLSA